MSEHLDLDALADALAGEDQPHLAGCADCVAALEQLRAATGLVATDLAALPLPPVPDRLEERITAALARESAPAASQTVLPAGDVTPIGAARSRRTSWIAAVAGVAAAAAAIVGGGVFLTSNATDTSKDSATASRNAAGPPTSSSGTDYSEATLRTAVPTLLGAKAVDTAKGPEAAAGATSGTTGGAPQTTSGLAADPLATLRTTPGLASCLASLTEPTEAGIPLALDYASYKGAPALIVVLPAKKASQVAIWVVGAGCHDPESDLLYYVKVDRP